MARVSRGRRGKFDDSKKIGLILRKLVDLIERSSSNEIDALIRGERRLEIVAPEAKDKKAEPRARLEIDDNVMKEAKERLRVFEERESGREYLRVTFATKLVIERFARFLDLPVQRADTFDAIVEKIVEAEIGSRLRSEAVRGKLDNC